MSEKMTRDQVVTYMRSGSKTGKLATVRNDGSPHVVPIWFDFDDATGDVVFVTGTGSVKAANIRRDPRVSLVVDDEEMPFAFAKVDGTAEIIEDADDMLHWATETCRRYVGDARAEEFGRRNAVPGEVLVRVTPTSIVGYQGVAD